MLEFILSVVPLILLCTAFGLLIINFDEVLGYLLYVAKNLVQTETPELPSNQLLTPDQVAPPKKSVPFYQYPFIFIMRLVTLFQAIFLPEIHISARIGNHPFEEANIFNATAQQEAQKSQIKTYNTPTPSVLQTSAAQVVTTHFSSGMPSIPIFAILKNVFFYLMIIFPFALLGVGIMLYMTETKATGESLDEWMTSKVGSMIELFSSQ